MSTGPDVTEPLKNPLEIGDETLPLLNLPPEKLAETIYSSAPPDTAPPLVSNNTPLNPGRYLPR